MIFTLPGILDIIMVIRLGSTLKHAYISAHTHTQIGLRITYARTTASLASDISPMFTVFLYIPSNNVTLLSTSMLIQHIICSTASIYDTYDDENAWRAYQCYMCYTELVHNVSLLHGLIQGWIQGQLG